MKKKYLKLIAKHLDEKTKEELTNDIKNAKTSKEFFEIVCKINDEIVDKYKFICQTNLKQITEDEWFTASAQVKIKNTFLYKDILKLNEIIRKKLLSEEAQNYDDMFSPMC